MGRIPTIFVSHGSPMMAEHPSENDKETQEFFESLGEDLLAWGVQGVVCISAHWQEKSHAGKPPRVAVTSTRHPELIYDFYGFPDHLYKIKYNGQGNSNLAKKVQKAIQSQNLTCDLDDRRGFDHGAWVPLKLMFPDTNAQNESQVPIVQLSLSSTLDPEFHVAVGKALQPLRDQGILILGSGGAVHNLRELFGPKQQWSSAFIAALTDAMKSHGEVRREAASSLTKLPIFRQAHPTSEHFMPVAVVIGTAHDDENATVIHDVYPKYAPNFALHAYKIGA
ncbi:hypothetical protein SeMB42_g04014 [Synchytrium endobioticum]|uniref:Extradiol ring-cleavage dioxygenase class III enzyme subunit B domain-containing protein n=1 Tax=Synchytrium endobioticum TaxID=286115 RepID=A0A507CQT2_9FUNG|nr:hypothetical protein SeLEV6574_g06053 [Synchytrium endobioticum]TPX45418.1 hypothetical protein SeMB42_g04014 [Synchytrium endobioticum]